MTGPELLTLEDAAARLPATITVKTLRGLIAAGRLPRRKIGRFLYLTPADLWSLARCPESDSPPASTNVPTPASGSSETAPSPGGQATALASAQALRRLCKPTSQAARPPAPVVPLIRTS